MADDDPDVRYREPPPPSERDIARREMAKARHVLDHAEIAPRPFTGDDETEASDDDDDAAAVITTAMLTTHDDDKV